MRKNRFGLLVWMLAIFMGTSAAGAAEIRLCGRWINPNDRRVQEISFSGNPMLIMLPGENLQLSCESGGASGRITVLKDGQPVREDGVVNFTAPEKPGSYYIPLSLAAGGRRRDAEICVLVPFKASARKTDRGFDLRVDGEEIGHYRHPSRSGNAKVKDNPDCYQPPVWWLRVTPMNHDFEVAPGLAAGELVVASEDTGLPHTNLVPVCYPMWKTIGALRGALTARGIPGRALKLISMFRTPPYNRSVGSNAFGRHIYGDAFDFYIDLENDGKASDLNRDGKLDRRDAHIVVSLVEDLQDDGKIPLGGIGVYNTVGGDHEVTMHLDMRGHRATWCYRTGPSGKRSEHPWASRRFSELDRHEENLAAERAAREGRPYSRPRREPLP